MFGTHTDYAGGRSLVAAVPRGFVFLAAPRPDRLIRVVDARAGGHAATDDDVVTIAQDPEATGNLFRGQTLLVEALDLLIPRLPLGASRRDRLFDLRPWSRTPFLDR